MSTAAPVTWRKARRSNDPTIGACVEVADLGNGTAVRDSKNPAGPHLAFSAAEWRAFMAAIKADQYGL